MQKGQANTSVKRPRVMQKTNEHIRKPKKKSQNEFRSVLFLNLLSSFWAITSDLGESRGNES